MKRQLYHILLSAACLTASGTAASADVVEQMTDAYFDLLADAGDLPDRDTVRDELALLASAMNETFDHAEPATAAFVQAAALAQQAHRATIREPMYDAARALLTRAAGAAGKGPEELEILNAWNTADPVVIADGLGREMTERDFDAYQLFLSQARNDGLRISDDAMRDTLLSKWASDVDQGTGDTPSLFQHLSAWSKGALEIWSELSNEERQGVLNHIQSPYTVDHDLVSKITGVGVTVFWLANFSQPLTQEEQDRSPQLVYYMNSGAFAGPLVKPVTETLQMMAEAQMMNYALAESEVTTETITQMMRMNNWMSMNPTDPYSWEGYRYMMHGY